MSHDDRDHGRQSTSVVHRFDPRQFSDLMKFLNSLTNGPAAERTLTAIFNTLQAINGKVETTMSKLSEYADAQKESLDEISTAVDGIVVDVKTLNDKITELQNSPDRVTPEDQARIDALQAQGKALAAKLKALDDATPAPEAPPPSEPPVEPTP